MPAFRRANETKINAFLVRERYLFKHFFDDRSLFSALESHYNGKEYRFEVREADLHDVREVLSDYGFGLVVVDALEPFTVAVPKYSTHPDNVFKESVDRREDLDYHLFLMKDQVAVEEAVRGGAIRAEDLEDSVVF